MDATVRALVRLWDLVSPFEFSRLYRRVRRYTMCSNARLRALYEGIRYVVNTNVPGDVVECGCAKGGSAALMALALRKFASRRTMWLFDTFRGLPAPTIEDPDYEIANLYAGSCVGSLEEVKHLFKTLQITDELRFVPGLFQSTLPTAPIAQIALLHIDGDWYESVKACLENLYDKVVPDGIIQFDDYGYWKGAKKAVDEFFDARGVNPTLRRLDYSGRVLMKPPSDATA